MNISLEPSSMLGHWTQCEPKMCEFQHGKTMIYVSYNDEKSMNSQLKLAEKSIDAVLEEQDKALEFATKISKKTNPEFWKNANRITLKQKVLIVYSIHYTLENDLPIYEISWNPTFEAESDIVINENYDEEQVEVTELPNNHAFIEIKRIDTQKYEQVI